jgi:hypothetical protein
VTLDSVERKGSAVGVAQRYRRICEQADLRLIEQRGWFWVGDPRELLAWYRDILVSMRANLVAQGLARDGEIDSLVRKMDAA